MDKTNYFDTVPMYVCMYVYMLDIAVLADKQEHDWFYTAHLILRSIERERIILTKHCF
jgi:hypothetical protein